MRNRRMILFAILYAIAFIINNQVNAQVGRVHGQVCDGATGEGLANVAVFIPYTSVGVITDANGNFVLPRIRAGQYNLEIRHLSFEPQKLLVVVENNKDLRLHVLLDVKKVELDEVIKSVELADWDYGFKLFQEFFLGDPKSRQCRISNPEDLIFYYEGDALVGVAKKPLKISNRYLGYELIYYLDYFKYLSDTGDDIFNRLGDQYAFEGVALFTSRESKSWFRTTNWRLNREKEYQGSLRHFLASLYTNTIAQEGFRTMKAWQGYDDIQYTQQLSSSMLRIKTINIDSIYTWDSRMKSSRFLYYFATESYPLDEKIDSAAHGSKLFSMPDTIFVFHDQKDTPTRADDLIATLSLSSGRVEFNRDGTIQNQKGQIFWKHHDNRTRIIRMVPRDFVREEKVRELARQL
ncbi:MAG: carboxypeptidase-like regulatory domain-containing protein [Bacteroidetes bacterium]|jgi:hypothetical protein|nr:carboxypeptidase-like regulatory domain-containing protein [Bacteroidota bacterium]MBT3749346.1 carboxypeptidase-like regulatory domain-containing protein [Bacteroidota bacterium]MBT4401804.1 carboxypeptidase-like regulatory domain-containing protein [Bacteroidota bacterium]MBT4410717.1 carboxypeptidase-like regulatory domain-containing protein [Bacteroidota bacterium]MBT5426432.1 carboxypeptidase-like regulatory domain-containing protein [Bacteroidota bacterium]